ncbi:protein-disulfide reductase DsbD family protein [Roseateles paludis]|uniref:Protein-disulfide reductase DsbD domain-containing protein n=1 Tax=Roseateles paludis TaxID=3145238 RepID=A0ABV0FVB6_9BURK
MYARFLALCLAMLLGSLPALAAAPVEASTDHVQARLLSSRSSVAPGERFSVALEQRIKPHWHTYWLNPGDSGQATSLQWTLPAGAQAGEIEWPTPSVQPIGPLVNYGYEGQVGLAVQLSVPADAKPGSRFTATAAVRWLVCKDICIPEQVTLGLDLPVAATGTDSPDAAQLKAYRAALPEPAGFALKAEPAAQGVRLVWPSGPLKKAYFFAATPGAVNPSSPQALSSEGAQAQLLLTAGDPPLPAGQPLAGVLLLTTADGSRAYQVSTPMPEGAGTGPAPGALAPAEPIAAPPEPDLGLAAALGLALLGGLILNLMPCVFPVLSIKALALVQRGDHKAEGLAYTAGVLASFALLGAVLVALRAGGQQIGWGFQFHSPVFVYVVAVLLFLVALSLAGLLDIGSSLAGLGSGLAARQGWVGTFFTGVLAAVVATPCTAPFMGAAIAFAVAQPAPVLIAVLLALGLGLALPFLVLAFWPAAQRWLPRPGAWMETFRQFLAFPMLAAVVWLLWVLAQQAGPDGVAVALLALVAVAFGLWWRRVAGPTLLGRAALLGSIAVALLLSQALHLTEGPAAVATPSAQEEAYAPERLAELRAAGKPVFVNLTAAWCISCLVNERVALSRPEVQAAFAQHGVAYLKGDWTREDPKITTLLKAYGRSGVPLYLYFAPGAAEAVVLPQILTPSIVTEALAGRT